MQNTSSQNTYALQKRAKVHRWSLVIGNLLEHFDSSLYGFLAPVIGRVFFPNFSPLYQIILAFSVYLITFVGRPFGGIFFSKLTYQYGPLRVLSWSLLGVAFSTGLMGLLPTPLQIGLLSPLLLITVRFFQSFCAAGESAIAGYYLIENTEERKHLSWSAFYHSSTIVGILFASSISSLVLLSENPQDVWRYPFIAGFFLGLWALWLRFHYREISLPLEISFSESYRQIFLRLKNNSTLLVCLVPIYGFSYITYSIPFIFLNPFLTQTTDVPLSTLLQHTNILFWLDAFLLPCVALLLNRFKWTFGLFVSAILFMIGVTLLLTLSHLNPTELFILRLMMVIGGVGFSSALTPWTNKLLPAKDKYLIHSVSYNLGSELFGRSAPFICFWIYACLKDPAGPLLYILGLSVFACGFVHFLKIKYNGQ